LAALRPGQPERERRTRAGPGPRVHPRRHAGGLGLPGGPDPPGTVTGPAARAATSPHRCPGPPSVVAMRPGIARCATALLAGCLLVAACGGDDGEGDASGPTLPPATATDEAPPPGRPPLAEVQVTPTEVATADEPLALVAVRGTGTLLVGERGGRVRALLVRGEGSDRSYELVDEPVLDIAEEVTTSGSEQGLLDIEPTPDGTTLYVSYSVAATGATRVVAYPLTVRGDGPPTVDTGAGRGVVTVEQPASNHNGGDVEVGPDGYLYVTLGDGGGSGDQFDNAQDPAELLGSILRIDPTAPGGPGGTDGYGIPPDNPFADGGTGRPEV